MSLTVRSLLVRLGVTADTGAVQRFDHALAQTRSTSSSLAGRLNGVLTSALGNVAAMGFAVVADASARMVRGLISSIVEYESLKAALIGVTKGATAANAAWASLTELAKATPFSIGEVTNAFIRLKNVGLDSSNRALLAYGDIAASIPNKTIMDFVEAVADATLNEWERLNEFGIKAKVQGENVALTFKGTTQLVKNDAASIEEALIALSETNFGGSMARQSKTLGGLWSNLKDQMFLFAIGVGEAGLSDALRELLIELGAVGAGSGSVAKMLGQTLAASVRGVTRVIRWLRVHADQLRQVVELLALAFGASHLLGALDGAQKGFAAVLPALKLMGSMLTLPALKAALLAGSLLLVALVIDDLVAFMQGRPSILGDMLSPEQADLLRTRLERLGEALSGAWEKLSAAGEKLFGALATQGDKVLKALGVDDWGLVAEAALFAFVEVLIFVTEVIVAIIEAIAWMINFIVDNWDWLWKAMVLAIAAPSAVILGVPAAIVAAIAWMISGILEMWPSFIEGAKSAFIAVRDFFDEEVIAPISGRWAGLWLWAADLFVQFSDTISAMFSVIGAFFDEFVIQPISAALTAIGEFIDEFLIQPIAEALEFVVETVADILETVAEVVDGLAEITGFGDDEELEEGGPRLLDLFSGANDFAANAADAAVGGSSTQISPSSEIGQVNVTIQGTTGMDSAQVASATSQGLSEGLDGAMRKTQMQLGQV